MRGGTFIKVEPGGSPAAKSANLWESDSSMRESHCADSRREKGEGRRLLREWVRRCGDVVCS